MTRRRIVLATLATGLTPLLVGAGAVTGVYLTHPRNENAFLADLSADAAQNVDSGGFQLADLPPRSQLIAQGDAACDWLGAQPLAFWRSGPAHRFVSIQNRYASAVVPEDVSGEQASLQIAVGSLAWLHLCPASMEFHRSHGLGLRVNPSD